MLTKFIRAIARAQKLIETDKEKTLALGMKTFPNIEPPVFKSAFEISYPSFSTTPNIPLAGVDKALEFTPAKGKVTASQIVDNAIADAAH